MSSSCFYLFMLLLVSLLFVDSYSPPVQPVLCNAGERFALLQFKESFAIREFASVDPHAYPKILSWNLSSDCCSWDGVDCEDGHVISLNLTSSRLFGSINSNSSLFKLNHLQWLILPDNHFNYSPIPPELALLSTTLTHLDLRSSYFAGQIPSEISMLSRLVVLQLSANIDSSSTRLLQLTKLTFTSLVQNMRNLEVLGLSRVDISSTVPNMLSNLSSLSALYLKSCNLVGEFPSSVFLLPNLQNISIRYNEELTGHLPQFNRSSLKLIMLSNTSFSGPVSSSLGCLANLEVLLLRSCHLYGRVPFWIQNLTRLTHLDLGHNLLRGSLPTPPPSIIFYSVSSIGLTGEMPPLFCNLSSLTYLWLNHNNLSGELPRCVGNMSSLTLLNVNNNNFYGDIPHMCANGNDRMEGVNFAKNQLQGKIPMSLANCTMLRSLNVGHNELNDTFPFWMGKLNGLQLLILGSNRFHGAIEGYASSTNSLFPNLRIIDLSHNGFSGHLPSALFYRWKAMKSPNPFNITYMEINNFLVEIDNAFSTILANKGSELEYDKIPNELATVDFSSNNFSGEIPESIGNLNGLYVLNLSNNYLTGPIAHSLANLSEIESLDLSNNNLCGEIPQELAQLKFLEILNVSHNNLTGQVPRGQQFDTFQDSSFDGNVGLCGELLIRGKCRGYAPPSKMPICFDKCEDIESSFPEKSDWIVMMMGCGAGLVVGVVMGNELMARKPEWFVKVLGRKMNPQRRKGRN